MEKLSLFTMCDNVHLDNNCDELSLGFDIAFECVGGSGAENAINAIISLIDLGGNVVLTGVSEENTGINTRPLMEKGIILTGSTRSTIEDFERAVSLLESDRFREYIKCLISNEVIIKNIDDYYHAFEYESGNKSLSKNVYAFM